MLKKAFLFVLALFFMLGMSFAEAMTVPPGQESFSYDPVASPVISSDPAQAKPIGVGLVAEGGSTLSLQIALEQFSGLVDVYFAIYAPAIDPYNIYILKSDYTLQPLSVVFEPWKGNTAGPINEKLFGDIPILFLPAGTYYLYLAVTPSFSLDSYYLWETYFIIPSQPPPDHYTLSVSTTGNGNVTSSDGKIQCGSDCSESYSSGTTVTLTATPAGGWSFSGWSGACSGTGTCTVTMASDMSVTATFTQQPPPACANIAGKWNFSESATVNCCADGDCETEDISGSGTITINQNGCNVSWKVPNWDANRAGSIKGNDIEVSGLFVVPLSEDVEVNFTRNTYTAKGTISGNGINMNGSGIAEGTICYEGDCYSFTCTTVKDTVKLTRSNSISRQAIEENAIKKPSVLFLNKYLKIFTAISH